MHASGHSLWASIAIILSLAMAGCTAPQESQESQETEAAQDAQQTPNTPEPSASTPTDETAPQQHSVSTPDDIRWQEAPPSLPAGARIAVLSGDPTREGPFTMRAEFPPGYEVPRHTHASTEHVTILEGTAHLATGDGDRASAVELPPGSFFVMPPGMEHTFYAGDEPVVLQVHGTGPWDIRYVDPADDPRQE